MRYVYYDEYKKTVTIRNVSSTQHGSLIGKQVVDEIAKPAFLVATLLDRRGVNAKGLTIVMDVDNPEPSNTTDTPTED